MTRALTRRLPQGGRIDRERPIAFTLDGRRLEGFAGDTLASALLANGVTLGRAQLQATTARAACSPPGSRSPTASSPWAKATGGSPTFPPP